MSSIGILIKHPSIDPDQITTAFGVIPTTAVRRGDMVTTPRGTQSGDRYQWSSWSYFDADISKNLNARIVRLLEKVSSNEDLITEISIGGGLITFIVRPESTSHIHCELAPNSLALLSRLSITLGLEIFPDNSE